MCRLFLRSIMLKTLLLCKVCDVSVGQLLLVLDAACRSPDFPWWKLQCNQCWPLKSTQGHQNDIISS